MYTYTSKVNGKTFFYTGKGMSTNLEEAKKVYSRNMAIEMNHHAKLTCLEVLNTTNIVLTKVDDIIYTKVNEGNFLTEEND